MDAFILSFLVIVPAEMADKTQIVALLLASRFRKPVPVIAGMLAAILANHLAAALVGQWIGSLLKDTLLHGLLGVSFLAAAAWAFIPDKVETNPAATRDHRGIFVTTFIAFTLAELGDKTQLATLALAAQFHSVIAVTLGSALGMAAVDVPAVLLSHTIAQRVPMKWIRILSGILFAVLGFYELSMVI